MEPPARRDMRSRDSADGYTTSRAMDRPALRDHGDGVHRATPRKRRVVPWVPHGCWFVCGLRGPGEV